MTLICFLLLFLAGTTTEALAQQRLTFSPNGDGVKDHVTFRFKLDKNASISTWLLEIKDQSGNLIKNFTGKDRVPEKLKWDGKDLNSRLVADGTYVFSLNLVTPAGNRVSLAPSPLIVDRVRPQVKISVDPVIFSPNGDGVKDETRFTLRTEDANGIHSWVLDIKDKEDIPARSIQGKGPAPAAIQWDGRGDFEEEVPDGSYTFTLRVHDLAGNKFVTASQPITINRAGQVSLVQVDPILISPNGDGVKDKVTFRITSAGSESMERWVLKILNRNGKVVQSFDGSQEPPSRIFWNGMMDDEKTAPDGSYHIILSETDQAGNTATTPPQPLEIDTTPPVVETRLEPNLLSPNGDGIKDEGTFYMKAEDNQPLEKWSLNIVNDVGITVHAITGLPGSKPRRKMSWKGDGDGGAPLIDGSYTYYLLAVDIGGNRAQTPVQQLRIDRDPPVLTAEAGMKLFSPNGDGVLDDLNFNLNIVDASPIETWSFAIKDSQGKVVRSFTNPVVQTRIAWDGKSGNRVPLPDGDYTYVLSAQDVAGNKSVTPGQSVTIGATKPIPSVRLDLKAISPNADGFKDVATFQLEVKSFNRIKEWNFKITDKTDQVRRTFHGRGDVLGKLIWRGEDVQKRQLPDGDYHYHLEVVDEAGNRSLTVKEDIRIDTIKPALTVQVSPDLFSPNGDGVRDEAIYVPDYKDASPVAEWKLVVKDSGKKVVKKFSGSTELPLSLPWKGRQENGKSMPDGGYTYIFSARDNVGNESVTLEQIARIDNTPPVLSVQAEPFLFSPNADGVKDETTFLLDSQDVSKMSDWKLVIQGPEQIPVTFTGLGKPPKSYPWDGKNERKKVVQDGTYQAVLEATDEVGNRGQSSPFELKVDNSRPMITVTAETDSLEGVVPKMTFRRTEKDLVISLASEVLFDTGQGVIKSQAYPTLMKVVHLIRRYPKRKVRIEGHADTMPINNEIFANNMELSLGRAKAVKDFFAEKGKIEKERMTPKGYGDTKPKATNATPEGRRQNRRVEIVLLKGSSN